MCTTSRLIQGHYTREDVLTRILDALRAAGKHTEDISRDDLAAFEEFHIRGRDATRELAKLAGIEAGMSVLDIGCGIGGPARTFAAEFGVQILGIDLVPQFVEAATELSRRVGLSNQVRFEEGDATKLRFPDRSFDGVVLEHVNMNVRDKAALFAETARVLRPAGKLGLYEICAGAASPPRFPLPWASDPGISFLVSPDELLEIANSYGLRGLHRRDLSQISLQWIRQTASTMSKSKPGGAINPRVVMGNSAPQKLANLTRCLEEDRVRVLMAVLERDA